MLVGVLRLDGMNQIDRWKPKLPALQMKSPFRITRHLVGAHRLGEEALVEALVDLGDLRMPSMSLLQKRGLHEQNRRLVALVDAPRLLPEVVLDRTRSNLLVLE